jgi:drug/metabolite transporter (DMT)-like permease
MTTDGSHASSKTRFSTIDVMLIGVSFVWGINFSVVKTALADFFPLSFNSVRFSLASLFILMLLWVLERDLSFRREDMWRLVLLGLIGNTTYQLLYIHGIARTTASNSSLILATTPIFVALLSSVLRVERVERKVWQSVVLSFIGILLITQGVGGTLITKDQSWIGDLLILTGTICWSIYTVLSKPLLQRYSPLKLTTLTMVFGTLPLVLVSIPSLKEQNWSSVSSQGWLGLTYSFCFAVAIGYVLWYTGVSRIGSARTSLYSNLTPVIAVAVAWLLLSETMTLLQVLGAVLVLTSLYLARRPTKATNSNTNDKKIELYENRLDAHPQKA